MNYKTIKDKHIPNKSYVWCDSYCVGHYTTKVYEKKDIDWQKYREDKTLRMSTGERWYTKFYPYAFPNEKCSIASSKKEAIELIVQNHKNRFIDLLNEE